MKNLKLTTLLLVGMTMLLTACGGGGGGSGSTSTGGTYYTHAQLANEFVRRVNSDVSGYDLELVKTYTLQEDYIVVYDWTYRTYDAYYIGHYNVGENLNDYLWDWNDYFFFQLRYDSTWNEYVDPVTGIRFEKQEASGKDLAKLKAFKQDFLINKTASSLQDSYGLSESKSVEVARIAYHIQNAPAGSVTNADIDRFAKKITGSTVTEFQEDFMAGDVAGLNARIETAQEVTGMGPEATQKLLKDMFLK
jgi:hypothetical protein